jgi:hypothetical protein
VRILVTGSREWRDEQAVTNAILTAAIDFKAPLSHVVIVHGDYKTGADRIARAFAESHPLLHHEPHPADWHRFGKRAGAMRNKEMVEAGAQVCLGFICGTSTGTLMCLRMAREAGIPRRVMIDHNELGRRSPQMMLPLGGRGRRSYG